MKTVREIENYAKLWDVDPRMDLLAENEKEEAYIAAKEGEYYLIYFTAEGNVKLDLSKQKGKYSLRWIDIENAEWIDNEVVKAGSFIDLKTHSKKGSVAVLKRKRFL